MSNDPTEKLSTEQLIEKVHKNSAEAMKALETYDTAQKENFKKHDALITEQNAKIAEFASQTAEDSQKLRLRFEGEEKARKDFEEACEAKAKSLRDLRDADVKRMDTLEAALQRPAFANEAKQDGKEIERKWHAAFDDFFRKSRHDETMADFIGREDAPKEVKELSVISNVDGGYLVSPEIMPLLRSRVIEGTPMRSIAKVVQTGKDHVEFPTYNDRMAIGGWVVEKQARPATATPKFGTQKIFVNEIYAEPPATQKMIDDADFDVEAFLIEEAALEFERAENTAFVLGDGIEKPQGFLTYAGYSGSDDYQPGKIEQIKSGENGKFTYDGLMDLTGSLKGRYQPNAVLFGKRLAHTALMKVRISNTEGEPIFNRTYDKAGGLELQILGKRFIFADDMPAPGTNSLSLAYGDFRAGYVIVDRMGVRILRDVYTSKPFVLFYMTKRVGGDVVNYEAIKLQKLAA